MVGEAMTAPLAKLRADVVDTLRACEYRDHHDSRTVERLARAALVLVEQSEWHEDRARHQMNVAKEHLRKRDTYVIGTEGRASHNNGYIEATCIRDAHAESAARIRAALEAL
jgi:hypothetical protein